MKKSALVAFALLAIFSMYSCGSDPDPVDSEPDLAVVNDDIQVNRIYEDLDNFTLEVILASGYGARKLDSQNESICPGVMIDHDEENRTVLIDFGDGCTSPAGLVRKGKVHIAYTAGLPGPGSSAVITFDGYEVDGYLVEGKRNFTVDAFNFVTATIDIQVTEGKITWPDGSFVTYTSSQERVITISNPYIVSITGTASGIGRAGYSYNASTAAPLTVKQDCIKSGVLLPTSGVVAFSYEGIQVSVDYGDGNCDKTLTLTYPGGAKEITVD